VDAWGLTAFFQSVTAVDLDADKVQMARYNFDRLGVSVNVVQGESFEFLRSQPDGTFDLIYIDPARRDEADRRKVTFADCEPDILPMLPHLLRAGRQVWIKASPMIRIQEALDQLGLPALVRVLAVQGECREILFGLGQGIQPGREARWLRDELPFHFQPVSGAVLPAQPQDPPAYLLEADVSLYKAEIAGEWMAQFPEVTMNHPMGYGFSPSLPPNFPGRAFRIVECCAYKPKLLKKAIQHHGWKKVHLTSRHFDLPVAQVRQALGLAEGDDGWVLLTRLPDGTRMAYLAQRA
jgi:hypothetical protein